MKKTLIYFTLLCTAIGTQSTAAPNEKDIINHYADLALAMYSDSLTTAQSLQQHLKNLIHNPTVSNLDNAKSAWKVARIPYQQTEAYRFGNAIVDEWEGKVNAWPLDEGLIDYVATSYGNSSEDNPLYTANVIANTRFKLSNKEIDASKITTTLLSETLHEIDGVEANVATGYHAIEFLLWGQDLNGTGKGAGNRPVSDYDLNNCSWGNCDRRGQYLLTAGQLLIQDLEWMVSQWTSSGEARLSLLNDEAAGINSILTGMGSLSYGELAGERIKLGVLLHDPEEEHDCFSDNTHNSHFYDIKGIQNVYIGNYTDINGKAINGPSLSDLVASKDKNIDAELQQTIMNSLTAAQVLVDSAEKEGVAYDQLLAENNIAGNAKINAVVNALLQQTKSIETAVGTLGFTSISFEGSDSLDSSNAVFK
jgi:putative iron-regulated protein